MALPNILKSLIEKHCMGVIPSDSKLDEIFDLAISLDADSAEVSAYMKEMIAGPTKRERLIKEEAKKKKAPKKEAIIENKDIALTPESVVNEIIENMVSGFENINLFRKNDRYKVCKYLVTQREWEVIMGTNPSWQKSPNYPVVNITYAEAEEFVNRVNKVARRKGYHFMIPPTDWQWLGYQKKCSEEFKNLNKDSLRAGVSAFAWNEDNSEMSLHDVGKLKPTAGIYDAAGLVYEMGQTKKYNSYKYGAFNEPLKSCFGGKSSDLMYVDKRYNNLGLRLICMDN